MTRNWEGRLAVWLVRNMRTSVRRLCLVMCGFLGVSLESMGGFGICLLVRWVHVVSYKHFLYIVVVQGGMSMQCCGWNVYERLGILFAGLCSNQIQIVLTFYFLFMHLLLVLNSNWLPLLPKYLSRPGIWCSRQHTWTRHLSWRILLQCPPQSHVWYRIWNCRCCQSTRGQC